MDDNMLFVVMKSDSCFYTVFKLFTPFTQIQLKLCQTGSTNFTTLFACR